jgi:phospholipid transport system substrate-binding protein
MTHICNKMNRRAFGGGALAIVLARPALALNADDATAFIKRLIGDIYSVIDSGAPEAAMIRQFEELFVRYADVQIMAQYALGVDARSATAEQKSAFNAAFAGYIAKKYGKRFRQFIGGRIEVEGARKIKAGFEIKTTAYLKGENPIEVIFLVSDKSGELQFFNMFLEGVNLLLTERSEIGSMLDMSGGDLNATIHELNKAG